MPRAFVRSFWSFVRASAAIIGAASASVLIHHPAAHGQAHPNYAYLSAARLDSGELGNPGLAPAVVYSDVVLAANSPWLRLVFDEVVLEGDSQLVLTSLEDGDKQVFNKATIAEWGFTSAFFNGPAVQIDLVAAPKTTNNRVRMTRVIAGSAEQPPVDRAVCEQVDQRVPSTDARVARLLTVTLPVPACPDGLPCNAALTFSGCTGFMISQPLSDDANNRVLLSAGHCFDTGDNSVMTVAQFGAVPLSGGDCSLRHPPAAKQFAINHARRRSENLGPFTGHDWAAFVCYRNPTTNRTPFQEQGAAFNLAGAGPALGTSITKFGYGVQGRRVNPDPPATTRGPYCKCVAGDQYATFTQTQQTSTGQTTTAVANSMFQHNAHTCPADSGSPVIAGGNIVGIHVGGFCSNNPPNSVPPTNAATSINAPHVVTGINQVATVTTPVNDLCANALAVVLGETQFVTTGATTDGPTTPNCMGDQNQIKNDVWFKFTVLGGGSPTPQPLVISTCGSDFDTRLAAYTSCPGTGVTALACDDDGGCGSRNSQIVLNGLATGQTIYIRVGGFNGATSNRGMLSIRSAGPPNNNHCSLVADMPRVAVTGRNFFFTFGATADPDAAHVPGAPPPPPPAFPNVVETCGGIPRALNRDVWFTYTSPTTGNITADLCAETLFDSVLAVYDMRPAPNVDVCPPGTLISCSDDSCGLQGSVTWPATTGTTYIIRVGAIGVHSQGSGFLTITAPSTPPNDNCAGAIDIPVPVAPATYPITRAFNNSTATTQAIAGGCVVSQDLWYTFRPDQPGIYVIDTCGLVSDTVDTKIAVYTGGCGGLALVTCADDECGLHSRAFITVTAPAPPLDFTQYRIRIGCVGPAFTSAGQFRINGPTPAGRPANDACPGLLIQPGNNVFSTINATPSFDTPPCFAVNNNDVWFWFVAQGTTNSTSVLSTCGNADFDTKLAAHAACPPETAPAPPLPPPVPTLACNDDAPECPMLRSRISFPTTPGTPFTVRVAGLANATGVGTLRLATVLDDRCTAAGTITLANEGATPFDTTGAMDETPAIALGASPGGNCMGQIKNGIFMFYFATYTGLTRFSTCGSAFDTQIAVYSTNMCNPAAANQAGCNDNFAGCGNGMQSQCDVPTIAGQFYLIHIGGSDVMGASPIFGTGVLTITPQTGAAPTHDQCNSAAVAAFNVPIPFDTTNATTDGYPDALCANAGQNDITKDLWYRFTAPTAGTYIIDTCLGANFDTRIAVYAACPPPYNPPPPAAPPAHVPLACNDDYLPCGQRSRVSLPLAANTSIVIRVGGHPPAAPNSGTGILRITRAAGNDPCASPTVVFNGSQTFDTTGATTDGPAACTANQDIWFSYTATRTGRTRFSLCGSTFDTKLAIYSDAPGTCPPVTQLKCVDDSPECGAMSRQSETLAPVTNGTAYTIRIGGHMSAEGPGTLTITPFCLADFNANGVLSVQDIFDFLASYFAGEPDADINRMAGVTVQDVFDFLAAYFAGC